MKKTKLIFLVVFSFLFIKFLLFPVVADIFIDAYINNFVLNNISNEQIVEYLDIKDKESNWSSVQLGAKYIWRINPPFDREIPTQLGNRWDSLSKANQNEAKVRWFREYINSIDLNDLKKYIDIEHLIKRGRQEKVKYETRKSLTPIDFSNIKIEDSVRETSRQTRVPDTVQPVRISRESQVQTSPQPPSPPVDLVDEPPAATQREISPEKVSKTRRVAESRPSTTTETTARRPERETPRPETTARRPERETPRPETTARRPDRETPRPETTARRPERETPRPETTVRRPDRETQRPETTVRRPEARPSPPSEEVVVQRDISDVPSTDDDKTTTFVAPVIQPRNLALQRVRRPDTERQPSQRTDERDLTRPDREVVDSVPTDAEPTERSITDRRIDDQTLPTRPETDTVAPDVDISLPVVVSEPSRTDELDQLDELDELDLDSDDLEERLQRIIDILAERSAERERQASETQRIDIEPVRRPRDERTDTISRQAEIDSERLAREELDRRERVQREESAELERQMLEARARAAAAREHEERIAREREERASVSREHEERIARERQERLAREREAAEQRERELSIQLEERRRLLKEIGIDLDELEDEKDMDSPPESLRIPTERTVDEELRNKILDLDIQMTRDNIFQKDDWGLKRQMPGPPTTLSN